MPIVVSSESFLLIKRHKREGAQWYEGMVFEKESIALVTGKNMELEWQIEYRTWEYSRSYG